MKASNNDSKRIGGNSCLKPRKMRIRAMKWPILLVIVSILVLNFPLIGLGTEDPLTSEERAWLKQHDGKIIVNREAGWPPIIDTDKAGNSFGIVMDYQELLEKKLNFKFKPDKLDSWENFMERFRNGKIDVNNNLQKNPKRTEYALFTKPYIEIPNVIIVRKELADPLTLEKMRGMKIAVTDNFAIHISETFDGQIDLALLDIKLPDIDGRNLYPLIMKARSNLKVIVCSGYSIDGPARKILDAGAQDFIQKPFSIATLSEKLKEVLEGK